MGRADKETTLLYSNTLPDNNTVSPAAFQINQANERFQQALPFLHALDRPHVYSNNQIFSLAAAVAFYKIQSSHPHPLSFYYPPRSTPQRNDDIFRTLQIALN